MDYNFLSLYTRYISSGDINYDTGKAGNACFARVFKSDRGSDSNNEETINNNYVIWLAKGQEFSKNRNLRNMCMFSIGQVRWYLDQIKKIYKFSYGVEEKSEIWDSERTYDWYIVNLSISGNMLYHKVILTLVRYLYEYPTCFMLRDAFRMKESYKEFRRINIFNIYNIVSSAYMTDDCLCDQVISVGGIPKSIPQLKTKLKSLEPMGKRRVLNSIYEPYHYGGSRLRDVHTEEFWSEESFEKRASVYIKSLNYLIKSRLWRK